MEVSGRGAYTRSEAQQGSDDVTNVLHCDDCHDNGQFEVASAFCANCTDYLCTDCVRQHRRMRRLKDHIILEGAAMPKEKPDEISISELSASVEQFRVQKKLICSCKKVIDDYRVLNRGLYDKSIEAFETFKSKIDASLDLLGKRVHREAGELKERNEKKLDSLSESVKSLQQKLESHMSDMETKEKMGNMDELFVAVKNNKEGIAANTEKIDEVKKSIHIQTYMFVADPTVQNILDTMVSTNPLQVLPGGVECTAEIKVNASRDKKICYISGIVEISPTDIVAADFLNECLKQIDVNKNIIVTRRALSSNPSGVTVIPCSRVAVTMATDEIHYFDTKKQLAPCGGIKVDGCCIAIQSTEDTLIVAFSIPAKVEIMDFEGHVKRSFITDSSDTSLFLIPLHLSLSPDHTNIYVTDHDVVTCLSTDGRVNWKYTGRQVVPEELKDREYDHDTEHENNLDEIFQPSALATDAGGCLYISSIRTNSIHVVSRAGNILRVIPVTQYRIKDLRAVCYSKTQKSLYVWSESHDTGFDRVIKRLSFH